MVRRHGRCSSLGRFGAWAWPNTASTVTAAPVGIARWQVREAQPQVKRPCVKSCVN